MKKDMSSKERKNKKSELKAKVSNRSKQKKGALGSKDTRQTEDKQQNEFPGYPHYPSNEDIMNPVNDIEKETFNEEQITPSGKVEQAPYQNMSTESSDNPAEKPFPNDVNDDLEIVPGTDADVTPEDITILGSDELNPDAGDDEDLKNRVWPVDMAAEDLDIPGAELDDANEMIGEEDEENNSYSIGGDRHED